MKKKVLMFIVIALGGLAVVPAVNLLHSKNADLFSVELYNLDVLTSVASRYLYRMGISISPENVIIGKDGWLFLGDNKRKVLTTKRNGGTDQATEVADDFARWVEAWQQHLADTPLYALIGPDKSSIYPEFLPAWAMPANTTILSLIEEKGIESIVIPTDSILDFKDAQGMDLYYKTDTHWNKLGSWIAYQALSNRMLERLDLTFLGPKKVIKVKSGPKNGGDLSRYLHLKEVLKDTSIAVSFDASLNADLEVLDFASGELLEQGSRYKAQAPREPTLIRSSNALNQERVLWIRDSFGNALAPLMAMTFRETLQLDYRRITSRSFAGLIADYKPDMVLLTVVERNLTWGAFRKLPNSREKSGANAGAL